MTHEDIIESVMLVSPNMGWWRGVYQLPRSDLDVTYLGVELNDDNSTTPQTRLVNDKYPIDRETGEPWIKQFRKLKTRQVRLLDSCSVSSGIQGVKLIPRKAGVVVFPKLVGLTVGEAKSQLETLPSHDPQRQLLLQRLEEAQRDAIEFTDTTPIYDDSLDENEQSISYDLHVVAERFARSYDDIMSQIRSHNSKELWDVVKKRVPQSAKELRQKFYCGTIPIMFAPAEDIPQAMNVTGQKLREYDTLVRQSIRTAVDDAIRAMIDEPRQELAKVISHISELIAREGHVTTKTFRPLRAAIDKLKLFTDVTDDTLLRRINELSRHVDNVDPADIRENPPAAGAFLSFIRNIHDELVDEISRENDFRRACGGRAVLV